MHSEARPASHCRVLPPGGFTESFMAIDVTVSRNAADTTNVLQTKL